MIERAATSSHPISIWLIGSEVDESNGMLEFVSGSATIHAVHASRYVPRCRGVMGGAMSDHRSVRLGMVTHV